MCEEEEQEDGEANSDGWWNSLAWNVEEFILNAGNKETTSSCDGLHFINRHTRNTWKIFFKGLSVLNHSTAGAEYGRCKWA